MTSMIERVARAICANDPNDYEWDWLTEGGKAQYFASAEAAIEAMREPTADMRSAVREAGGVQALAYANAAWPTMIDAALKEATV